ncbi:hypothetical protein C8F01DRAFT_275557 [Mycena amicta]|nr:hypothetical protein C8F01DRAFT_275557 [Mycena amicta]
MTLVVWTPWSHPTDWESALPVPLDLDDAMTRLPAYKCSRSSAQSPQHIKRRKQLPHFLYVYYPLPPMAAPDGEALQSPHWHHPSIDSPWDPQYTRDVYTTLRCLSPDLLPAPGNEKARKKRRDAFPPAPSRRATSSDVYGTAELKKDGAIRRRSTTGGRNRPARGGQASLDRSIGKGFGSNNAHGTGAGARPDVALDAPGIVKPFVHQAAHASEFTASDSFADLPVAGLDFDVFVRWDMPRDDRDGELNPFSAAFDKASKDTTQDTFASSHAVSGRRNRATPAPGSFIVTTAAQAHIDGGASSFDHPSAGHHTLDSLVPNPVLSSEAFCQGHGPCPNCLNPDPGAGQWRFGKVSQMMLCSACGLYESRKSMRRPPELEARKVLRLLSGGRR